MEMTGYRIQSHGNAEEPNPICQRRNFPGRSLVANSMSDAIPGEVAATVVILCVDEVI